MKKAILASALALSIVALVAGCGEPERVVQPQAARTAAERPAEEEIAALSMNPVLSRTTAERPTEEEIAALSMNPAPSIRQTAERPTEEEIAALSMNPNWVPADPQE